MTMYVFKSKADADLIMMKPIGDQILRIVGHEPSARGIIEQASIPAAIASLEVAIAAAENDRRLARKAGIDEDSDAAGGAAAVGLGQRAWPMLEMMRRSLAERADIVWGV